MSQAAMRISYFYNEPFPSKRAAPIQILNTARALCEEGARVTVYTGRLEAESVEACLAFYGLAPHEQLGIVPLFAGWRGRFALQRALKKELRAAAGSERHAVISRGEPGLALFRRLRRLPQPAGERRVYEAHRPCFTQVEQWYAPRFFCAWGVARATRRTRAAERYAVEAADGLLCLNGEVETALNEHFAPTAPVLILPSGTSAPTAPPPGDARRDLDILYAGKLVRRKGVRTLVEAMQFLPEYRLHLVGGTAQQVGALRQHAEACGVADRVTLAGFVEPSQVRSFYERARVGVCPLPEGNPVARRFNSPLKLLNMMACGTPIVASDVPSVRALVTHDETALLVKADAAEAFARALRTLLEDRPRAQRLAEEALRAVHRYTWAARARRLYEFLETLP